ncbi:hypothetical protein ACFVZR_23050 [Streptomyces sp. NPDC058316]|uniref:hypothetical protein n=1 Tax=Streptomyces sp. NPDC058316 TaxID=3346442 RepID=UPI0036E2A1F9
MRVNRAWLGLAVLMLPTLLVAMDATALLLALPRLSADLGADNVEQLWISDSYGFMVAGLSSRWVRSATGSVADGC